MKPTKQHRLGTQTKVAAMSGERSCFSTTRHTDVERLASSWLDSRSPDRGRSSMVGGLGRSRGARPTPKTSRWLARFGYRRLPSRVDDPKATWGDLAERLSAQDHSADGNA